MPTPLGHSLLSVLVAMLRWRRKLPDDFWKLLIFFVLLGLVPDFDFLPGIFAERINHYHHEATHTLGFALLFSVVAGLFYYAWRKDTHPASYLAIFAVLFGSVLIDALSLDTSFPYGIPLFWPFSDRHFISPWVLFSDVDRGTMARLFGWHNLKSVSLEIFLLGPPVILTWLRTNRGRVLSGKKAGIWTGLVLAFLFLVVVLSLKKVVFTPDGGIEFIRIFDF